MTPTSVYYYHKDHLGSSTVMSTASGKKADVESTTYLPYGGERGSGGISRSNYKFTDQEFDGETGLYNYDARLYDPVVGLFLSADTIVPGGGFDPQMLNRFAYVRNNPLKFIDPSGHHLGGYNGPNNNGDEDESGYDLDDNPGNWDKDDKDHYRNKELGRNSWKVTISRNGNAWIIKKKIWDQNGYQRSFDLTVIDWGEFDRNYEYPSALDHIMGKTYDRANITLGDMIYNIGVHLSPSDYQTRSQMVASHVQWQIKNSGLEDIPSIGYTTFSAGVIGLGGALSYMSGGPEGLIEYASGFLPHDIPAPTWYGIAGNRMADLIYFEEIWLNQ